MDYNQNEPNNRYVSSNRPADSNMPNYPQTPGSGSNPDAFQESGGTFPLISMILGIASIILCCTGILSIPLASVSIILAVLSARKGKSMSGMSIAGICTSIFGMILGIVFLIYIIFCVALVESPELRSIIDPLYENTYGMTFEEYMEYMGTPLD